MRKKLIIGEVKLYDTVSKKKKSINLKSLDSNLIHL